MCHATLDSLPFAWYQLDLADLLVYRYRGVRALVVSHADLSSIKVSNRSLQGDSPACSPDTLVAAMAPPCRPAAAAKALLSTRQHVSCPSHALTQLQAGRSLLQQPPTERAAAAVVEHLKAATRNAVLGRSAYQYDDDGPQQMCLLNQYLAWCLLGLSELPPSSTAGSSSDSCNHSGISSSSGSTGAAREAAHSAARMATGPASSSGAYAAAMSLCLAGYNCILDPVARVDGHPAARELHEVIVAPATGTLCLLGKAAEELLKRPGLASSPGNVRHMDLCSMLLGMWGICTNSCFMQQPSSSSSSSSSASSGSRPRGGGRSASSSSSSSSSCVPVWGQLPHLARLLPAIVRLFDWYLQQPVKTWGKMQREELYVERLVEQLREMVDSGAAAAAQAAVLSTSSQGPATGEASLASARGPNYVAPGACVMDGLQVLRASRTQVERFLWHALGAATASLVGPGDVSRGSNTSSSAFTPTPASSSSSRHPLMPKHAGFKLRVGMDGALRIFADASFVLLQLASDPPQDVRSAAAGTHLLAAQAGSEAHPGEGALGTAQQALAAGPRHSNVPKHNTGHTLASSRSPCLGAANTSTAAPCTTNISSSAQSVRHGTSRPPRQTPLNDALMPDAIEVVMASLAPLSVSGYLSWPRSVQSLGQQASSLGSTTTSSSSDGGKSAVSRNSTVVCAGNAPGKSRSSKQTGSGRAASPATSVARPSSSRTGTSSSKATTTSSSSSSSSSSTGVLWRDGLATARPRLQLLAVAIGGLLTSSTGALVGEGPVRIVGFTRMCLALSRVLLLIAQQLQLASAGVRNTFMHTPAGSILLRVLGDVATSKAMAQVVQLAGVQIKVSSTMLALVPPEQQPQGTPPCLVRALSSRVLVEQLLLPALLLEPVAGSRVGRVVQGSCSSSGGRSNDASSSGGLDMSGASASYAQEGQAAGGHAYPSTDHTASLVLVPHGALHLPPGRAPDPHVFFLVEQLVRHQPTVNTLALAAQLLQGAICVIQPAGQQQQQQHPHQQQGQGQQQGGTQPTGGASRLAQKEADIAELYQLAYCSLARSVVGAIVHDHDLAAGCAGMLMALAADLTKAATGAAQRHINVSSSCAEPPPTTAGHSGGQSALAAAAVGAGAASEQCAGTSSTSTHTSGSRGMWGMAASLAAATAAGAYAAHLGAAGLSGLPPAGATGQAVVMDGAADTAGHASSSHHRPAAAPSSSSTASSSSIGSGRHQASGTTGSTATLPQAAAAGCGAGAGGLSGCGVCCSAMQLLWTLRCLEQGWPVPTAPPGPAAAAALAQVAQQRDTTEQQHVMQQLLGLAWRRPVPKVCGNVLCGRQEGPAAASAVRRPVHTPRRTLCGGCSAAWYCCEACQQEAWPAHSAVCGRRQDS